ncbi:MAG TPA: Crp/Fnr family transcriptional regulator [Bacteroidia bacterium]|nr:Crp/Fnr family transcriptional regulator [Bacteroidia bacterium]
MAYYDNTVCPTCPNINCFIKTCSPKWIELIGNKKSATLYKRGQQVITEGQPIFGLYFINRGQVKVISSDRTWKEQIVRLAADGHILGHRGYGGESYPVSAVTMNDSVICFIDNDTLLNAFMHNPSFTYKLMMFYSHELREVEKRMKCMATMTVAENVVFALSYLKEIFGYDANENVLNANITRMDIAALAGTSEEEVVRTLTELEKEKVIKKIARKIRILDEKKLNKLIEKCCR